MDVKWGIQQQKLPNTLGRFPWLRQGWQCKRLYPRCRRWNIQVHWACSHLNLHRYRRVHKDLKVVKTNFWFLMVFNISRKYKIQLIYNCYLIKLNELSIPVEVAWYLVRVATRRLQLATWSGEQIWAAEVTATKTMRRARNIILGVIVYS